MICEANRGAGAFGLRPHLSFGRSEGEDQGKRRIVLAQEQKRAAWSLAIGAVLAGAVYLQGMIEARRTDANLQILVTACAKSPTDKGMPDIRRAPGARRIRS